MGCRNVTKQQCDTKWVVNEQGEEVWECNPSTEPTFYHTLEKSSVDLLTYDRVCQPRAHPVCTHSTEVQCKTVEWEDCTDVIIPSCFNTHFKVPYQEYDHRLRCSVGH